MLNLPKSTELSKQLPKKAIYAKFNMNTAAREKFDADISKISIAAEISPTTTAIAKGETVSSIFVLLVSLKRNDFDEKTISSLSKLIDQNILFLLDFEGKQKLAVHHGKLMQGEWTDPDSLTVSLKGLNLDSVWENIVRSLEGGEWNDELSLDENIARNEKNEKFKKEIARLEKLARAEKQPKKKFELAQKINQMKQSLEGGE